MYFRGKARDWVHKRCLHFDLDRRVSGHRIDECTFIIPRSSGRRVHAVFTCDGILQDPYVEENMQNPVQFPEPVIQNVHVMV